MENLYYAHFSEINFKDHFFNSLYQDYPLFENWIINKCNDPTAMAYVLVNSQNYIEGFLYLKEEFEAINDVSPPLPRRRHLKIGTFKFESRGTLRGERFIKKIFDHALTNDVDDIYVTVYPKHNYLIRLFQSFGFSHIANKGYDTNPEHVLLKDMRNAIITGDIINDYPFVSNMAYNKKFLLSIRPEYHTELFPDSILNNESPGIVKDISYTNSIKKIYICSMQDVVKFRPNDIILMYRTSHGLQGSAYYNSVITSLCVVSKVTHINNYSSAEEFIAYCKKYSVFTEEQLRHFYNTRKYPFIISFTYNLAFPRRPNRATLINEAGLNPDSYWGVMELTNTQFDKIIQLGDVNESIIINQA